MADVNTTYQGYSENYPMIPAVTFPGPTGPIVYVSQWQADQINADFKAINETATNTIADVKQPFFGTTKQERIIWVNERLKAISTRAQFIQKRVQVFADVLKSNGQASVAEVAVTTFNKLFAVVVPVIGAPIAALVGAFINASKQSDIQDAQTKIQAYQTDIESLASIQAALKKEGATVAASIVADTTGKTLQPGSEAPNPNAKYYWIGGAVVLLFFLLWLKNRRKR